MFRSRVAAAGCAAVLLLCVYGATAAENVVTITGEDSFRKVVSESEFVVVEFYAPWCGHCKRLAPEYEKAATALKEEGSSIVLAKVDATDDQNKDLASKFGVRGYPTLKVFRSGDSTKPSDYEGPREADGIVNYVKKISGPASSLLESAEAVEEFKKREDTPVLAYFNAMEGDAFAAYMKAASALRSDYGFAHISDASFVKECENCASGSIVAFNKLEKTESIYNGEMDGLSSWLEKFTKPVVITFGDNPAMKKALGAAFQPEAPTKIVGITAGDADSSMMDMLVAQAKEHDDLLFMYADKTMDLYDRVKSHFGVEDKQLPVYLANNNDGKWHLYNAESSALPQFIADFKAGKIEKTIKSQDPPAEPYEDDVRVVVAKEFDDIVFSGKDVMIEFYAPWCGHCKSLAPTYSKVAAAFKDNDKVEIAKMDATANDVPSSKFNVKGFPTIYFVKGGETAILYDGARTEEGFKEFIKKHATASAGTHDEL